MGAHLQTRVAGRHPPPSADTRGWEHRGAPASHRVPRERSRCFCRGTGMAGGGVAGGGSEPRSAVQEPPKMPRRELPATHGPSQASWGGSRSLWSYIWGWGGAAAVTEGRRDGWPEGPGRARPAAAQMFPRGTPLFCGAPRGERSRREPGGGGGGKLQPPRLRHCPGPG